MCDPVTAIMGAQAAIGAVSALQAGSAAASAHSTNAALMDVQAANRNEKAKADAQRADRDFAKQQGAVTSIVAAQGINLSGASDVRADDSAEHALAVESIRWSAKNDVNNLQVQANSERNKASSATTASYIGAAGSLANAAGGYYRYQARGVRLNNSYDSQANGDY